MNKTTIAETIAIPALVLTCSLLGYQDRGNLQRDAFLPAAQRIFGSIDDKVLGTANGIYSGLGLAYWYYGLTRRKSER